MAFERLMVGAQSGMKEKGPWCILAESLATLLSAVMWKVENVVNQVI